MSDKGNGPKLPKNWKWSLGIGLVFAVAVMSKCTVGVPEGHDITVTPPDVDRSTSYQRTPEENSRSRETTSGSYESSVPRRIGYSDFVRMTKDGDMDRITIYEQGRVLAGRTTDGKSVAATYGASDNPYERLRDYGASIDFVAPPPPKEESGFLGGMIMSLLPILLLIGFMLYMQRQAMGGGKGGIGQMTKAKFNREKPKIKFDDVAGADEAKEDCMEMVDFLKNPQRFAGTGARVSKGILMVGPPGTGKTLLAKAIAGEASVPFFSISGSDFVEMFVGVGAARVRDLFENAKKEAPSIIFVDEIDAVGRKRGEGMGGGNDEREQTLNQMLVEMDGFEVDTGVLVIAATNRPDVLDPALIRPGRFDRQVEVGLPDMEGREKILAVHIRKNKVPVASDLDLRQLAIGTPGRSGADLENIVNEAALFAAREKTNPVTYDHFLKAIDKILMGAERKTLKMTELDRRTTAYHEAGHALQVLSEPHSDPVYKATIIPRGRALGYVIRLPEGDRISQSRAKLHADLAIAMGGRVAEEIFCGGRDMVTTGASGDFQQATQIATAMVTEWGLHDSEDLGHRRYVDEGQSFSGHFNNISEHTKQLIDQEIKKILDRAYKRAHDTQTGNMEKMHLLAQALLKYETLTRPEIEGVVVGKNIDEMRAAAEAARKAKEEKPPVASAVPPASDEPPADGGDSSADMPPPPPPEGSNDPAGPAPT